MPLLNSQPVNMNIQANFSNKEEQFYGLPQVKYIPLDQTGSPIDLTGYSTATLSLTTPQVASAEIQTDLTMTVVSADATGIVLSATHANMTSALPATPVGSYKGCIVASNGSNEIIVAVGTISLQSVG